MNKGKRIEVEFLPDGEVRIEAHGYSGQECTAATAHLEKLIGGVARKRTKKAEFFQKTANTSLTVKSI